MFFAFFLGKNFPNKKFGYHNSELSTWITFDVGVRYLFYGNVRFENILSPLLFTY